MNRAPQRRLFVNLTSLILFLTFGGYLLVAALPSGCASVSESTKAAHIPLEKVREQIQRKKPAALTAGTAKVDITPPVGTPLAGYSKRHGRPSTGIRDPLYVRVLALSDGEATAVFISADLLIFPRPLAEAILSKVASEMKIPRQAIILSATHTHSGTGGIAPGLLYEMVFGSYRPDIVEGLTSRIVWAIRQAVEPRQPVRWGVARGFLGNLTENRMDPSAGLIDPAMSVFFVESTQGKPLALLVNASAHPTLLGSGEMRFSADFPGELARIIETAYPGSVCLFINGAAGDLRPEGDLGSTPDEKIQRFSGALAEKTIGLVNQMSTKAKGDLVTWGWRLSLPPPRMRLGWVPIPSVIGGLMRPRSMYQSLIALDRTIFVPLSAELTTELGQSLRQKLTVQGDQPILFGYANGYYGYAVTPEQYKGRAYEAWMPWYGPPFGESLVEDIPLLASLYSEKEER